MTFFNYPSEYPLSKEALSESEPKEETFDKLTAKFFLK